MPDSKDAHGTRYTEPTIIQDIFTTGAAHVVAACGGAVRMTFYVDIDPRASGIETEHRIMDRVVLPRESIPALIAMLTEVMATHSEDLSSITNRRVLKVAH